ncbi:MAG: SDR family NAD(P)-dependent oxidoreductase, partial [Chloroflexota bacterium]
MTTPTGSESRPLLEGQRAVIVGASRGLGRVVAEAFADAGASLMLVAREEAPLIEVSRDCKIRAQSGQVALWHAADISRPNDVESMVQRAVQAFGSIDILVCNA